MKRIIILLFILILCLSGCSMSDSPVKTENPDTDVTEQIEEQETDENEMNGEPSHEFVQIKESPDKYTAYIKDYVSRNCATIGYESLGGDRNDYVGRGYIHLVMVTESGEYPGISDEELKNYYVVSQSLEPNTEVKFTFQKDSEGKEYENLTEWQSVEEIVLKVKPVGSAEQVSNKSMTKINASPDKYTCYVKDYVGRNLAGCGYISMLGDLRDSYGAGNLELIIITNDGSYIDLDDESAEEELRHYVVSARELPRIPRSNMSLAKIAKATNTVSPTGRTGKK